MSIPARVDAVDADPLRGEHRPQLLRQRVRRRLRRRVAGHRRRAREAEQGETFTDVAAAVRDQHRDEGANRGVGPGEVDGHLQVDRLRDAPSGPAKKAVDALPDL